MLPRRTRAYSSAWLDSLCASGEVVWIGAGALGRNSGRVALYFREEAGAIGPPPARSELAALAPHMLIRERLAAGACFFADLLAGGAAAGIASEALREALWDLVWAGEVTNDAWAPLRQLAGRRERVALPARAPRSMPERTARVRTPLAGPAHQCAAQRRSSAGTLVVDGAAVRCAPAAPRAGPYAGRLLLERYGVVTREQVLAEGLPGGFAALYKSFAEPRELGCLPARIFHRGLGGAQFALPGAIERLRSFRDQQAAGAPPADSAPLVIAAADPAQPYGAQLPWPRRSAGARRVARVVGAYVVLVAGLPVLYVERGGRGLVTLTPEGSEPGAARDPAADGERLAAAAEALAGAVHERLIGGWRSSGSTASR